MSFITDTPSLGKAICEKLGGEGEYSEKTNQKAPLTKIKGGNLWA